MPTYEYACTACANQWEEIQKISEDPLDTCPKCGQKTAKRQISGGNFILKGGGWYADLYASSGNKAGKAAESSSKSEGSSSAGNASAKSEKTAAPAASTTSAPSTGSSSSSSGSSGSSPSKT